MPGSTVAYPHPLAFRDSGLSRPGRGGRFPVK